MRLRLFVQIHLVLLYSVEEDILESYVSVDLQPGVRSEPRVIELLSETLLIKGVIGGGENEPIDLQPYNRDMWWKPLSSDVMQQQRLSAHGFAVPCIYTTTQCWCWIVNGMFGNTLANWLPMSVLDLVSNTIKYN